MIPDKLQQAWQSQASQTQVTVHADLLLKEVQRNQRDFSSMIQRRDVVEVAVGVLLLPYWIYQGLTQSLPWTWWLTVPALLFIIGFFLIDRIRSPQKASNPSDPLLSCVKNSLAQVEHQIWLLRNVYWWYLLPLLIGILAFFAQSAWLKARGWPDALMDGAGSFLSTLAVYAFLDFINQRAVKKDLEPRRQELLTLLASLGDEDTSPEDSIARDSGATQSSGLLKRWLITTLVSLALFALMLLIQATLFAPTPYNGRPRSSGPAGEALAATVADQQKEKDLVGLAAMVTVDGQLQAAAAHGERKVGRGVPVDLTDRWHLGGITKSITATMIARLVEAGRLKWTDTVGQAFPDAAIHDNWKLVTLQQLLTDTAGAPANFPTSFWSEHPPLGPERIKARFEAVLEVVQEPPAYPPGEECRYSNVGYTIAAAMAEKVTGDSWEDLVSREVFEPLKLKESGFGPPASPDGTLPQPRGHRPVLAGSVAVDDTVDNTPIMGPSGSVHMSLQDLSTFANEHLRGAQGRGTLLSAETYKLLHTPALSRYAFGWIKNEPNKSVPHALYWHNGSNTMWYALVAFIPEKNMVVAVTSNDGDSDEAEAAAWEIVMAYSSDSNFAAEAAGTK